MEIEFSSECSFGIKKYSDGTAGIPYDCQIEVYLKSEVSAGPTKFWVDGIDMESFLADLESLGTNLKGAVSLTSMSPGEFLLAIEPVDTLGHFVFKIEIGNRKYISSRWEWASAKNAFPLDSAEVQSICTKLISYFRAVFNA